MGLLLFNIGELANLDSGDVSKPLSGISMSDRENLVLEPGYAILIDKGLISKVAPEEEIIGEYAPDFSNGKSDVIDLLDALTDLVNFKYIHVEE